MYFGARLSSPDRPCAAPALNFLSPGGWRACASFTAGATAERAESPRSHHRGGARPARDPYLALTL